MSKLLFPRLAVALVVLITILSVAGCEFSCSCGETGDTAPTTASVSGAETGSTLSDPATTVAGSLTTVAASPYKPAGPGTTDSSLDLSKVTVAIPVELATTTLPTWEGGPVIALTTTTTLPTSRYYESDPHFQYAGNWFFSQGWGMVGHAGDIVRMKFTGTSISILATRVACGGIAEIVLDTRNAALADTYSSSILFDQVIWESGNLDPGVVHDLQIRVTDLENSAQNSDPPSVYFNGVQIVGGDLQDP
jgi:hypothetical protein